MKARKPPAVDETFRRALADVTPLPARNKAELAKPRPRPQRRPQRLDEPELRDSLSDHDAARFDVTAGAALSFSRPGVRAQALRQLRRQRIDDELDLHGLTTADARSLLVRFLDHCARNGFRHVRIVHGKGLRSANREPVLRSRVAGWLAQHHDVLAFREAPPGGGGSGALIVLLRAAR